MKIPNVIQQTTQVKTMKTKEELIDELKQETSIGCTLYLAGLKGDFPEDDFGDTNFLTVFEDTDMWSDEREYNENSVNEVFDETIDKIIVELGRLSITHNISGFCFDSTSKIYLGRSNDGQTNIDSELINAIVDLVNRARRSKIDYLKDKRKNEKEKKKFDDFLKALDNRRYWDKRNTEWEDEMVSDLMDFNLRGWDLVSWIVKRTTDGKPIRLHAEFRENQNHVSNIDAELIDKLVKEMK